MFPDVAVSVVAAVSVFVSVAAVESLVSVVVSVMVASFVPVDDELPQPTNIDETMVAQISTLSNFFFILCSSLRI
jgi:hypothetical protein